MEYFVLDTYDDLSQHAAGIVMDQIKDNNSMLLGAATGNTPLGLYGCLASYARRDLSTFSALRVMKLDEWLGLPMTDPGTCEYYLRTRLVEPLDIGADRYFSFNSETKEPGAGRRNC